MAFKKGEPRPENSGRKKGSRNIKSREVWEILERNEFDVVQELINLYKRTCLEEYTGGVAASCLKELRAMTYPTLKSYEHSVEVNPYLNKSYEELKELAREILKDDK